MYHYVLVFLFLGCNHRLQKIGCNHFLPKTENEEADHTANFETVTVKSKRVKLARAWPRVSQPPRRRLRPHRHPNHSAATLSPAPISPAAAGPKPARRSTTCAIQAFAAILTCAASLNLRRHPQPAAILTSASPQPLRAPTHHARSRRSAFTKVPTHALSISSIDAVRPDCMRSWLCFFPERWCVTVRVVPDGFCSLRYKQVC